MATHLTRMMGRLRTKGHGELQLLSSDITDKGEVPNPFEFTVDTNAPTLETGKTGISLKNPGIASGESRESESPNKRDWVRVEFDLGAAGGAPLDASTVERG